MAVEPAKAGPLTTDLDTDVAVVGAGIAGISVAYELTKAGRRVVVVDAGAVGGGMTSRTSAHLASAIDDRITTLIRLHGEAIARLAVESHAAAIDRIEAIQRDEAISCDFRRLDGFLCLAPGNEEALLDEELDAARKVGFAGVEKLSRAPLGGDAAPCLRFPHQGRVHPTKYLAGLARAIEAQGGRLFADTRVVSVTGGASPILDTEKGQHVTAAAIVVATNTPVNDRVTTHTKQAPYRSFAIAMRVPKGSVADALYWDTATPYHYVRLQEGDAAGDFLMVGGEDHKTGQEDDGAARLAALEAWARERFPAAGAVEHRWSGQVMEPVDGLAFIGRNPGEDGVFIATGDSGMGMTHGAIAGMLIADLVLERENDWAALYDPARLTPKAAGAFAKENLNVAAQYRDFVTPGDIATPEELEPGEGAVMRRGLRKVAVFRDEESRLHEHSAICPHMGCIVHWNTLEGCFDCPCHGSQFAVDGGVLNGPAISGLAPLDDKKQVAE
jgi:glycine/D-amino acid oxidase-like deaminating enzyme/nitrite reductase/ring-hydroxylating ferredoxin subunit